MLQSAPQFTPQQLLDAGHRAEADGKPDLAVQFYRQLAEQYAYAPEAAEARNGIGRAGTARAPSRQANGAAHHAEAVARAAVTRAARRNKLPSPRNHYRVGHALARVCSLMGCIAMVSGVVGPALYVMAGIPLPAYGILGFVGASASLVTAGMIIVLAGQVARAVFDQANAARDLVSVERARISD
jgi:hypothetical protein